MTSEFGLILCEMCGRIQDEENTESYSENHGPGHLETLSRTTCCKASYTDVGGKAMVDELLRIQGLTNLKLPPNHNVLDQITRDNLDVIIPRIETSFDL